MIFFCLCRLSDKHCRVIKEKFAGFNKVYLT